MAMTMSIGMYRSYLGLRFKRKTIPLTRLGSRSYSNDRQVSTRDAPLPFDAIPGPRPSLPLVGTGWIYFKLLGRYKLDKLHEANLDKYHRYGPIVKEEYQRGKPMVTLYDPSDFKEVFSKQAKCPMRPVSEVIRTHRESDPSRYPNVGLANMLGEEWAIHRTKLTPTFMRMGLANKQIDGQNMVANSMVDYIKSLGDKQRNMFVDGESSEKEPGSIVENVQDLFYRFTVESIMQMSINRGLGCFESRTFQDKMNDGNLLVESAKAFFNAQHDLYYGLPWWKLYETQSYKRLKSSQDRMHDILSKYVDPCLERIKKGPQSSTNESCILETLYRTSSYSDLEIKSTITDFIGGGIFTAANALTIILFHLALNQDAQTRLYEEIRKVVTSDGQQLENQSLNLTENHLEELKYLKSCIKESFRLSPTVPGIARNLADDLVLSNYHVPKGTLVFNNFMVTCRLEKYFSDPDRYLPERWMNRQRNNQEIHPYAMLPFGHGKRVCIGRDFAKLEMNVAIAKLVIRFKIELVDDKENQLDMKYAFIVIPEKPVKLKFNPR